jgi:hypothetical protein
MNCPYRKSDNTTTHRMAYLTGTTQSVSEGSSFGLTVPLSGAISLSASSSRGKSLTQGGLVEVVAPPATPMNHVKRLLCVFSFSAVVALALMYMAGLGFKGFLAFFTVVGGVVGVLNVLAEGRDEDAHRGAMDAWHRSWICMRCGRSWVKTD